MGDEVEEQASLRMAFESAIAALEPSVTQSEDGTLVLGIADAAEAGLDADVFQQLADSLGQTNELVASGELALGQVGLETEVAVG